MFANSQPFSYIALMCLGWGTNLIKSILYTRVLMEPMQWNILTDNILKVHFITFLFKIFDD